MTQQSLETNARKLSNPREILKNKFTSKKIAGPVQVGSLNLSSLYHFTLDYPVILAILGRYLTFYIKKQIQVYFYMTS